MGAGDTVFSFVVNRKVSSEQVRGWEVDKSPAAHGVAKAAQGERQM